MPLAAPVTAAADPWIAVIATLHRKGNGPFVPTRGRNLCFSQIGTEPSSELRLISDTFRWEATHGTIKASSPDRADRRGRSDAARDDLPAAEGERIRRHRVRKRRGRRTGLAAQRRGPRSDDDRR